jgi:hypothetical protein
MQLVSLCVWPASFSVFLHSSYSIPVLFPLLFEHVHLSIMKIFNYFPFVTRNFSIRTIPGTLQAHEQETINIRAKYFSIVVLLFSFTVSRFTRIRIMEFSSYKLYNEGRTYRLTPHPNANSLVRNLPNKLEGASKPIKCASVHLNTPQSLKSR